MSRLHLQVFLNSYEDGTISNNPSLNNFRWFREISSVAVDRPQSLSFKLAPGESRTLFDGSRTLLHDGTTQYQLSKKVGSGNTYVLKHVGGTSPQFRIARTTGADATTQVTVTANASVLTFASTGGTPFNLIVGGVIVGDEVLIGDQFSATNRGRFKIIAVTATSFSVENSSGVAEGPIILGVGFADQVRIYSASGVQNGDIIKILGGFSPASRASYEITAAQDNLIEFYSAKALPQETVTTNSLAIYSSAKKLVYLESNKRVDLNMNGSAAGSVEPILAETVSKPGMFLRSDIIWSMGVQNSGLETAEVFVASVE